MASEKKVNVLYVEDSPLYVKIVENYLDRLGDYNLISTDSIDQAYAELSSHNIELCLVDLHLEKCGRDPEKCQLFIQRVINDFPQVTVIIISTSIAIDNTKVRFSLEQGISYIVKENLDADIIKNIIEIALYGGVIYSDIVVACIKEIMIQVGYDELTERELEVGDLVRQGLTDKQIGTRLNIAVPTVRTHITSIKNKLTLSNKNQVAVWFTENYHKYKNRLWSSK